VNCFIKYFLNKPLWGELQLERKVSHFGEILHPKKKMMFTSGRKIQDLHGTFTTIHLVGLCVVIFSTWTADVHWFGLGFRVQGLLD
jgi:hypothetical protein